MSSSIFSSSLRALWTDRAARTLGFAFILVLVTGHVLSPYGDRWAQTKLARDRYWVLKTRRWGPEFDLVLMGDSRVYRGVSPARMKKVLRGWPIANFGFSAGSLSPVMCRAAEGLLEPNAEIRVVVIGVTPNCFTEQAARDEHYLQEKRRPYGEVLSRLYLHQVQYFFRSMMSRDTRTTAGANEEYAGREYFEEFCDDGWVASRLEPADSTLALSAYAARFADDQVSRGLCEALGAQVKDWSQRGIRVFGFRPPTTEAMADLEARLSGFDQSWFVARFKEAGGIWLNFDRTRYHSYDGSHLEKESAQLFSGDLAEAIRNHLGQEGRD